MGVVNCYIVKLIPCSGPKNSHDMTIWATYIGAKSLGVRWGSSYRCETFVIYCRKKTRNYVNLITYFSVWLSRSFCPATGFQIYGEAPTNQTTFAGRAYSNGMGLYSPCRGTFHVHTLHYANCSRNWIIFKREGVVSSQWPTFYLNAVLCQCSHRYLPWPSHRSVACLLLVEKYP